MHTHLKSVEGTVILAHKSNKMSHSGMITMNCCMSQPSIASYNLALSLYKLLYFLFHHHSQTGTNSTVTNEIRTAGVVISSLGLVLPFLVSVVLAAIGCIACVAGCMEALYCVTDVKEWMDDVRETRG